LLANSSQPPALLYCCQLEFQPQWVNGLLSLAS
jgi:hypothetical protein